MRIFIILILSLFTSSLFAQQENGTLKGKLYNSINNEALPFATVVLQGTTTATTSDIDGNYELKNIKPGLYNIEAALIGFEKKVIYEIEITNAKITYLNIGLNEEATQVEGIEVKASPYNKTEESPVSLRTIGTSEIERNPGGNRDISRVIQSLPGVASTASFRNDIIIRGGAPNENRFYLDGVEVPNINHFATQGASGGPVGMINVNFIREVDYYAGAFPANRGNALSSVFEFKQKDGNEEKVVFAATVGASDLGLTLDGPLGENSTFIFSVRRSYLQFLFKALQLPFLPTYNDVQLKNKIILNDKNILTIIGLGAIDDFSLNLDANETEFQKYILGNIPVNKQWNYTIGANYKHFREKAYTTLVVSRNHLNNTAEKYFNNDDTDPNNLLLDYSSQEIENKVRLEDTYRNKGWKLNYGLAFENVAYKNDTYNKVVLPAGVVTIDFNSSLLFNKYAIFGQASKTLFDKRLTASLGLRTDFNDYSAEMNNPLEQLSPRFSLSYSLTDQWSLNFNTGRYYQLPPYTVLGYRDNAGELENKNNKVKYIGVDHLVGGVEYNTKNNGKMTVESFYKVYSDYPFLLGDSVSLANMGGDFGVVGNEPVTSTSEGRAYGLEFLLQQKLYKGFYGIVAYTLVRSEFTDKTNTLKPSAWDNKHIINLTAGKKFKKNWELGMKWRFSGGGPYTPYDVATSSLIPVWDATGFGILDYDLLNTERLQFTHQLDVRVDKKYYFDKWSLNLYFDVQNIYNQQNQLPPILTVERDAAGNPVVDPNDPSRYQTYFLDNTSGNVLPTLGVIVEF